MSASSSPPQHQLKMSGLSISFPFKPYPAQLALMDRTLKCCLQQPSQPQQQQQQKQSQQQQQQSHQPLHALLESPTGSGKTLALLCASLAWQEQKKKELAEKYQQDYQAYLMRIATAPPTSTQQQQQPTSSSTLDTINQRAPQVDENGVILLHEEEDDLDAMVDDSAAPSSTPLFSFTQGTHPVHASVAAAASSSATASSAKSTEKPPKQSKTPKIFFSSRTHSQLAQVVSELKTTIYRPMMTILGSRQQYCIHPAVSQSSSKSDDCQKLLDFGECSFHRQVGRMLSRHEFQPGATPIVRDIEEFVTLGERSRACPYFAARQLAELATTDLVLCPYNYLIDPVISKSMGLDLNDSIVIIDEAHNIEDVSRGAASRDLDLADIKHTEIELTRMIDILPEEGKEAIEKRQACIQVRSMISLIVTWIQETLVKEKNAQSKLGEDEHAILAGDECLTVLSSFGVTTGTLRVHLKSITTCCTKPQDADKVAPHLNGVATTVLESLALVLEFMFDRNMKFIRDYRMVVRYERNSSASSSSTNQSRYQRDRDSSASMSTMLSFWCLNPAVAFSKLSSVVRSIILTSGTLSPMNSFASELGVPFLVRLEAPHVIAPNQILTHIVSTGPSGRKLNAKSSNTEEIAFQDELGTIVDELCQRIPSGVLCFFPSYALMDRIENRWKETKQWNKLFASKCVVMEPKGGASEGASSNSSNGGMSKFDQVMEKFTQANMPKQNVKKQRGGRKEQEDGAMTMNMDDDTASSASSKATRGLPRFLSSSTQTGGLFLAVNRGKLSEGIDFTDDQARAVLIVGIPYPAVKDSKVQLKKAHNDQQRRQNESLLTGDEWYRLQAYRAINQALGRTIRHKYDYGAVYFIDERYQEARLQKSLSKWIQPNLQPPLPFDKICEQTEEFFARWTENPPKPPASLLPPPSASSDLDSSFTSNGQKTMKNFLTNGHTTPFTATSPYFNTTVAAAATAPSSSYQTRDRVEISYQDEEGERKPKQNHLSSTPAARISPATAISTSPTIPTHLALSCRVCQNALAALPIIQPASTTPQPPYQQVIQTSYFCGTVQGATKRFGVSSQKAPSVSAMVCSVFALEAPRQGPFGWIGYPCAMPDGLPEQPFLAQQFYNIWSEEDQICYQPLCCNVSYD